jgi:hypothetical protein
VSRESPAAHEPAPHPPRAVRRVPVTLSAHPVAVTLRATLTRAVPAGTTVRLAGDSLRSVTGGFEPERLGPPGRPGWLPSGGRLPRSPLASGVDRAPRQLLRAATSDALAEGQEIEVAGTFHPAGSGPGPTLAPWADVALTYRVEAHRGDGEPGAGPAGWQPVTDSPENGR